MTNTVSDIFLPLNLNTVELVSVNSSKITNVSVYVGRAEITTVYTLNVKTGHKIVHIEELPDTMNRESLRCVVSSFLVYSFLNRCVESKDVGTLPSTISKLSDEKISASEGHQSWKMNPSV
jgi:hypothetical protein